MKKDSVRTPHYIKNLAATIFNRRIFLNDPCPYNISFDPLKDKDALKDDTCWKEFNFVNPPFTHMMKFIKRAHYMFKKYKYKSVVLVKNDTLGRKFMRNIVKDIEIIFFTKQIIFENFEKACHFNSALIIFGREAGKFSIVEF